MKDVVDGRTAGQPRAGTRGRRRLTETADAKSLVFKLPRTEIPGDRLRYSPGQFLTLRVPSDRTGSVARCYSLCTSPYTDEALP